MRLILVTRDAWESLPILWLSDLFIIFIEKYMVPIVPLKIDQLGYALNIAIIQLKLQKESYNCD